MLDRLAAAAPRCPEYFSDGRLEIESDRGGRLRRSTYFPRSVQLRYSVSRFSSVLRTLARRNGTGALSEHRRHSSHRERTWNTSVDVLGGILRRVVELLS